MQLPSIEVAGIEFRAEAVEDGTDVVAYVEDAEVGRTTLADAIITSERLAAMTVTAANV